MWLVSVGARGGKVSSSISVAFGCEYPKEDIWCEKQKMLKRQSKANAYVTNWVCKWETGGWKPGRRWADLDTGGDSCQLQPFTGLTFSTRLQHYTCLPYLFVHVHEIRSHCQLYVIFSFASLQASTCLSKKYQNFKKNPKQNKKSFSFSMMQSDQISVFLKPVRQPINKSMSNKFVKISTRFSWHTSDS